MNLFLRKNLQLKNCITEIMVWHIGLSKKICDAQISVYQGVLNFGKDLQHLPILKILFH